MSVEIDQVLGWRGRTVVDKDGERVGKLDEVYLDEGTDEPAWVAVKTGPLGLRRRVVPVADAEPDGDRVRLPFSKGQVRSAPAIDANGWVPERDQRAILNHYGLDAPASAPSQDGGEPGADDDDGRERIRLKRHTVTETVTRRSDYET